MSKFCPTCGGMVMVTNLATAIYCSARCRFRAGTRRRVRHDRCACGGPKRVESPRCWKCYLEALRDTSEQAALDLDAYWRAA